MRYTKKEIEICREIARYYQKPVRFGDWFIWSDIPPINTNSPNLIDSYQLADDLNERKEKDWFPLWTFEDAREWLFERGWRLNQHYDGWSCRGGRVPQKPDMVGLEFWSYENVLLPAFNGRGKTDLEAILKVVLAVLKEEK